MFIQAFVLSIGLCVENKLQLQHKSLPISVNKKLLLTRPVVAGLHSDIALRKNALQKHNKMPFVLNSHSEGSQLYKQQAEFFVVGQPLDQSNRVTIIGSSISGLLTALLLAEKGIASTVYEKKDSIENLIDENKILFLSKKSHHLLQQVHPELAEDIFNASQNYLGAKHFVQDDLRDFYLQESSIRIITKKKFLEILLKKLKDFFPLVSLQLGYELIKIQLDKNKNSFLHFKGHSLYKNNTHVGLKASCPIIHTEDLKELNLNLSQVFKNIIFPLRVQSIYTGTTVLNAKEWPEKNFSHFLLDFNYQSHIFSAFPVWLEDENHYKIFWVLRRWNELPNQGADICHGINFLPIIQKIICNASIKERKVLARFARKINSCNELYIQNENTFLIGSAAGVSIEDYLLGFNAAIELITYVTNFLAQNKSDCLNQSLQKIEHLDEDLSSEYIFIGTGFNHIPSFFLGRGNVL